jgi:hypothetical protein
MDDELRDELDEIVRSRLQGAGLAPAQPNGRSELYKQLGAFSERLAIFSERLRGVGERVEAIDRHVSDIKHKFDDMPTEIRILREWKEDVEEASKKREDHFWMLWVSVAGLFLERLWHYLEQVFRGGSGNP